MSIYDKIVAWILSIPADKRLHFVAGLIIASFLCITFHLPWPVVLVFIVAVGKEVVSHLVKKSPPDWGDIAATVIGGAIVQAFDLLGRL